MKTRRVSDLFTVLGMSLHLVEIHSLNDLETDHEYPLENLFFFREVGKSVFLHFCDSKCNSLHILPGLNSWQLILPNI